eukprot:SAG22_NODE_1283_length_4886_cov_53.568414_2_plen_160_part_00
MAAVHAGETETQLITVRATGSELISTAHEEKEDSARPGDSAVSGDLLQVFGSRPECDKFYETSGSCGVVSSFLLAVGDSLEQHELLCRPNWSDGEREWSNGGHEEEMFSVGARTKKTGQHATAENVPRVPSIDIIRCAAAAYPATPLCAGPLCALITER